jgi:serine/threonine-protein kinase
MGEVYRARDTKLDRDVAIKVLTHLFASDPDWLARFEQEARLLASLNHPHVAQIYGFEDLIATGSGQTHVRALVMELVDGQTLADRIANGPIVLDESLQIALQIADALESAHERGIIHRDLKPTNILLTAGGAVKVLDFGLAKVLEPVAELGAAGLNSPTIASPATQSGMILGTAAYMAPEQARGQPVDKRADIWAFGVVLYEMLLDDARELDPAGDWSQTLAITSTGALAYLTGPYVPLSRLTWIGADGASTPLAFAPRPFVGVKISADGRLVATASLEAGRLLLRVLDLERGTEDPPKIEGMNWKAA